MLITAAEISKLMAEEGLTFYLVTSSTTAANSDLGIPGRKTETRRRIYGTFKPPVRTENIAIPQGSSAQGELLVFFSAHNLTQANLLGARIEYDRRQWFAQYLSEVTHRGVILMHLIKLVAASTPKNNQSINRVNL